MTYLVFKYMYIISVISAVVYFLILTAQRPNQYILVTARQMVASIFFLFGYLLRIIGTSRSEQVLAQKTILLGGSFIYYFTFLEIAAFLNTPISRKTYFFLDLFSFSIASICLFFDKTNIVFRVWEIQFIDGFPHIKQTRGIIILLYQASFAFYACMSMYLAVKNIKRNSRRKTHLSIIMFLNMTIPLTLYLIELAAHPLFNLVPIGIFVSNTIIMILIFIVKIYDINNTAKEEAFKNMTSGMIAFNEDNYFQGCNPLACEIFPALANLSLNDSIDNENFYELKEFLFQKKQTIQTKGHYYKSKITILKDRNKNIGKILWFIDETDLHKFVELSKEYQQELEATVRKKTKEVTDIQDHVVMSVADIIENRDGNTGGHVKRTSEVVGYLCTAMQKDSFTGVNDFFCSTVKKAAPMHDFGKLAIRDVVLLKNGKFTDEEFEEMKSHAIKGKDLVRNVLEGVETEEIIKIAENIACYHHEKWNGKGYPEGLEGENIPLESRIMAIADVYDALVSKRCYKDSMSFEKADKIMMESFGSHFDPNLQKYYLLCKDDIEKFYKEDL